jgi:lysophospholipase L1-like esterase
MMRRWLVAAVLSVATLVANSAFSNAAEPALPSSMAAIGDSITKANDVCCWYGDHPSNSWSTGGASWDGVSSHYERIRVLKPTIAGHAYNDARSGARMRDAPGQAAQAVAQGARYVTILMGANDLCTSSTSTMTSVEAFRDQFRQTLATLNSGLPGNARIFVASIPDVYHLWELYRTDVVAQSVWAAASICQSLLSLSNTETQRQTVRNREIAFNTVLAEECGQHSNCKFDGNAVFDYRFTKSQVSKLDYFHPSLSGQAALAGVTWRASWWGA